jgi:hypothetical protein
MRRGQSARGSAPPWWRDAATAAAVIGLFVTLGFNTVGVWREVEESRETRRVTQVNLLTQLDATVNQAEQALNAAQGLESRCDRHATYSLERGETARLFAALHYYDYMSWLFNEEHLTLRAAEAYWAPNMLDAYRLGTTFLPDGEIDEKFAELASFQESAPARLWPPDPCDSGWRHAPDDGDGEDLEAWDGDAQKAPIWWLLALPIAARNAVEVGAAGFGVGHRTPNTPWRCGAQFVTANLGRRQLVSLVVDSQ